MPSRQTFAGLAFAMGLIVAFVVWPTVAGSIDSHRPSWLDWLFPVGWMSMFIVAGTVAGHIVAGPRGQFGFAVAFALLAVIAALILGSSIALEDFATGRYEQVIDMILFIVAYPLAFAAMGSLGTAIATRDGHTIGTVARSFALGGLLGGIVFSTSLGLHLKGPSAFVAFALSIAVPGFVGARALATFRKP